MTTKTKKDKRTPLQVRRGLCLKIADEIADDLNRGRIKDRHGGFDPEPIAQIIDTNLPLTYAEAEAELAEFDEDEEGDDKPSRSGPASCAFDDLRKALGLGEEHSIVEVIKAATERLEKGLDLFSGAALNNELLARSRKARRLGNGK